jgi:anti-sigma-K factor RskA
MASSEWHRPYAEELAAYILDALSAEEARAFELHLAGCAGCQAEERWLRTAVDVLPSSIEQFEPPLELRERLMATVHTEAQAERDGKRPPRRSWWSMVLRPATAVAAVAVLAAGVAGYLIRGEGGGVKTRTVAAKPIGAVPTAGGELVRSGNTTVLRVSGLPLQKSGRVYQVWLATVGGKKVIPSSLFVVDRGGHGSVAIPSALEQVQAVLVSNEPAGGSQAPTTKPVLQAAVQ